MQLLKLQLHRIARSVSLNSWKNCNVIYFQTIEIFQIGDSRNKTLNYFDVNGYVYSKKRTTEFTIYLRCKNSAMHKCKASVILRAGNFSEAIVKRCHNHESVRKHLDRSKFTKKLEQICREQPFLTPRACYQRTKLKLNKEIERKHIPSLKSFESYIFRCQKADIPPLPKTVEELEKMILELKYGRKYSHDERGQIFFRGVWRGNTGREKVKPKNFFCALFLQQYIIGPQRKLLITWGIIF